MYLTYAEYKAMGGTVDEALYTKYEYRAEAIINWYTFNRLAKDTEYPEAVKRCMFMLIDLLVERDGALSASMGGGSGASGGVMPQIASQSNDGVSVSYNVMNASETVDFADKEIKKLVQMGLQGVMNELGRKLLYRGLYPNE